MNVCNSAHLSYGASRATHFAQSQEVISPIYLPRGSTKQAGATASPQYYNLRATCHKQLARAVQLIYPPSTHPTHAKRVVLNVLCAVALRYTAYSRTII